MVAEPRPLMESVPLDELGAAESPPKRGRGRPRKLGEDGKPLNPPRRSPSRRKAAPRARSTAPKSLYPEIAATLSMLNMVIVITPLGSRPPSEALPDGRLGDELDEAEIIMLAQSLDTQCQRSPRFRKQVERILGVGSAGTIITTIGMIAARRASRHGILPEMLDPMLGAVMAGGDLNALASFMPPQAPPDAPLPETGEIAPMPLDPDSFDAL